MFEHSRAFAVSPSTNPAGEGDRRHLGLRVSEQNGICGCAWPVAPCWSTHDHAPASYTNFPVDDMDRAMTRSPDAAALERYPV